MNQLKRIMILADPTKQDISSYKKLLCKRLKKEGIEVVRNPRGVDMFIVIGGDGKMLGSINGYQHFRKPFFGINFGHKGFLMNNKKDDPINFLKGGEFNVFSFPLLELSVATKRGLFKDCAVNDVYVKPLRPAGSCKLGISINGKTCVKDMLGDGIIVSTALGSTAYNLAAGGSAVMARVKAISFTPNNVHTPVQIKPVILPLDTVISVEVLEAGTRRVIAICDGREYPDAKSIIIKNSRKRFKLALLEGENFIERLFSKIMKVD